MFATTGAGHILSVWDVSDVFEPLCAYPLRANRCDGTSLRWGPGRYYGGVITPCLLFFRCCSIPGSQVKLVYGQSLPSRALVGLLGFVFVSAERGGGGGGGYPPADGEK